MENEMPIYWPSKSFKYSDIELEERVSKCYILEYYFFKSLNLHEQNYFETPELLSSLIHSTSFLDDWFCFVLF